MLSNGGLAQSTPVGVSGEVSLSVYADNDKGIVGEPIVFDVVNVSGMDLSGFTYTLSDAPLDQLVEWFWTITPPAGAATTWSNVTRLAPGHNSRLTAYGRRNFIIPDVAGTWTFEVFGVDRQGNTLTASASKVVSSIDSLVSQTNTWLLYTDDLGSAPTHNASREYTSIDTLLGDLNSFDSSRGIIRVLVQGGKQYAQTLAVGPRFMDTDLVIFESYGGSNAEINPTATTQFLFDSGKSTSDTNFIFKGIDVVGPWDMTTETPDGLTDGTDVFRTSPETDTVARYISLVDCSVKGGALTLYGVGNENIWWFGENSVLADSQEQKVLSANSMFRGCDISDPPMALAGGRRNQSVTDDARRNAHTGIRSYRVSVLDACTFFSACGWSYCSVGGWPAVQGPVLFRTDGDAAGRINMQRCVVEGAIEFRPTSVGANPTNALIERCTVMTTHTLGLLNGVIDIANSGVTIRNCQVGGQSAARTAGSENRTPWINLDSNLASRTENTDPVRILNNTAVDLIDGSRTYSITNVVEAFSQQEVSNNLEYAPNYDTPHQPDGALVAESGVTFINPGAVMGYTVHEFTLVSDLAVGATSGVFSWFNDWDGVAVDDTTFSGSFRKDAIWDGSILGYINNFVTTDDGAGNGIVINKTASGWSITNNLSTGDTRSGFVESGVLKAGTYYLQLDRRHNLAGIVPGTAAGVNDGQLYAPAVAVTPDNAALVPYYDFKGNVRSSGSPTKGAIDPNGT